MSANLKLTAESLRELAEETGVCIRPVLHEVYDTVTGKTKLVPTPCQATRESKCPPCAAKNRRLRIQQCREGWHLDEEPEKDPPEEKPEPEKENEDEQPSRRKRSTRRRQDAPDLPRLPVEKRTVGKAFITPSGKTYRPSMFLTFTLPSYGRVGRDGTPRCAGYDYRRAALDAMHFPKLVDRLWQNLRRAVGYQVQYFSVVEEQHRLAPHLHAAVRGAIPRALVREVVAATYHQVWWPAHDRAVYVEDLPVWVEERGYVDPTTRKPLPTWEQALDDIDEDPAARPAHVVRFGKQLDIQGIIATEGDADRKVAYLTKYLTKSISGTYGEDDEITPAQARHMARLQEQIDVLPCSPRCWNWLRYGVQPLGATDGMTPGRCPGKAHHPENLGCGGRRVLVSRKWTGKTLKGHKADRAAVVRQVLEAAGVDIPEASRMAADVRREDGVPRFNWKIWDPLEASAPVYRQVMTKAIAERLRWKREYESAKSRSSPTGSPSANAPPADQRNPAADHSASSAPTAGQTLVVGLPVQGERSESRSDTQCP